LLYCLAYFLMHQQYIPFRKRPWQMIKSRHELMSGMGLCQISMTSSPTPSFFAERTKCCPGPSHGMCWKTSNRFIISYFFCKPTPQKYFEKTLPELSLQKNKRIHKAINVKQLNPDEPGVDPELREYRPASLWPYPIPVLVIIHFRELADSLVKLHGHQYSQRQHQQVQPVLPGYRLDA